jgi:transcriptional regulator with XRE-family HTH domain
MNKRNSKTDAEILRSLTEFDDEAGWSEGELDSYLRENGVDPAHVVHQVRAKVEDILHNPRFLAGSEDTSDRHTAPITSLVKEGEARGLSIVEFAKASGLSLRLLGKLESGLLRYSSIPVEKLADVATVIGRATEEVMHYALYARPNLQGAHFKSDKAPIASIQQDFFEAVAEDDSLTKFLTLEQLERLRALEAKYKSNVPSSAETESAENRPAELPPLSASLRAEVREIAIEFADAFEEMKRRGD